MRRERGMALILALLLVAAAALFATTMAERGRRVGTGTVLDRVSATALAAASGGVERARWALARDAEYTGESLRIGDCDVSVEIDRTGDEVVVRAEATTPAAPFAESVTRRVVAELDLVADALPGITRWSE